MLPIQTHMIPVQKLKTHDTYVYGNVSEVLSSQNFRLKLWIQFPYLPRMP
jgi:hypothetical protein